MAYTIQRKDGAIIIEDGTLNVETSLKLVGRDYFGYGEAIAQDLVDLLENFASADSTNGPSNPTSGQIWYNETGGFKYYNGTAWLPMTSHIRSTTVTDTVDDVHSVTYIYEPDQNGVDQIICVFSSGGFNGQDDIIVKSTDPLYNLFPGDKIGKGITLAKNMKLHGTATSAQYADLAELYASDEEYQPGTVLKIGGEAEVTQTTDALCMDVFGVVSSDPAYLMNSAMEGMTVAVALEGRVPVRVIGEVKKGQRLVASETPGVARGVTQFEHAEGDDWFRMVGRALEDKTTLGEGLVVAVVGAK